VTGYSRAHEKVITRVADNVDATPGALTIWGAIFRFEDDGTVYRLEQKAGIVRIDSEEACSDVSEESILRRAYAKVCRTFVRWGL
jgi:hypothetical protein